VQSDREVLYAFRTRSRVFFPIGMTPRVGNQIDASP
jgi:hypothetical protein